MDKRGLNSCVREGTGMDTETRMSEVTEDVFSPVHSTQGQVY